MNPDQNLPLILVLCTGNSCRSHMAEGILRAAAKGRFRVASAGSKPAGYVHPLAIKALAEIGIDISTHSSKHMNDFLSQPVETVITVCGKADQVCPIFPGQINRHHWGFLDPAHATGSEDQKMSVFREVRDEIKRVFEAYVAGRLDEAKRQTV
ncbi:MAG TPA: arsenate reductase ArsC [Verrucomicrobiae bacterium]|nr:arsenate reductase ArsC [Verrucomicrobiae bacterium]